MNILDKIQFKRLKTRNNRLLKEKRELSIMVDYLHGEILDNEQTIAHLHKVIEEQHQEIQKLKEAGE